MEDTYTQKQANSHHTASNENIKHHGCIPPTNQILKKIFQMQPLALRVPNTGDDYQFQNK
jgi:hypothetical protein